ncbi:MAG TPA: hypothetical protein VNE62_02700 [Actinomycetota bacterium]|nr:hypothetical protein [Actinomycetota bacterium]
MQDVVTALESALEEIRQALESLPEDLSDQARRVAAETEALLERLRAKQEPPPP